MAWLLPILLLLAALGKATADADAHGSPRLLRWFPRWSGPDSWKYKYQHGSSTAGPRFAGSTSWLVFTTDLWHTANFFTWLGWASACVLAYWLGCWQDPAAGWWLAGGIVANKLAFEPVYAWLRK